MSRITAREFKEISEEIARKDENHAAARVARKTMLHAVVLNGMSRAGVFDDITFQGGSCLAEVYGNPRLSEDLDFAGGRDSVIRLSESLGQVILRAVADFIDAEVAVKSPKPDKVAEGSLALARWTVSLDLNPDNPALPRERLKVELAGVPVYERSYERLAGLDGHTGLPMGAGDVLLAAESKSELLADKIVALAMTEHPRYRDAWDIVWLEGRGADLRLASKLVEKKFHDYGYEWSPDRMLEISRNSLSLLLANGFRALGTQLPADVAANTVFSENWVSAAARTLSRVFSEAASKAVDHIDQEGVTEAQKSIIVALGGEACLNDMTGRNEAEEWILAAVKRKSITQEEEI